MKKSIGLIMAAVIVLGLAGCASSSKAERRVAGNVPDFVKKALQNVPDDALVGVGTAKLASLNQSRTVAQTRARADISRQLSTIIQDMVRDYQASSEVDPAAAVSFQENFTLALSKSTLQGVRVLQEDTDTKGNYWAVVIIDKSSTANEINQAQAAARLAVPALASFNAEDRMNDAYARALGQDLQVTDKDQ